MTSTTTNAPNIIGYDIRAALSRNRISPLHAGKYAQANMSKNTATV
jgi:hypothetical protein